MRAFLVFLMVPVALAGCAADNGGPVASTPSELVGPIDQRVSNTQGAIHGVLIDNSLLPLGNATVILFEGGAKGKEITRATTDPGGEFGFPLLDPTTYRVGAEAEGYGVGSTLVTVVAGEVSEARLQLQDTPAAVPYVVLLQRVGRLSCATSIVVSPVAGNCPGEPDQWFTVFEVPDGFVRVMTEAVWDTTEHLAQYYYVDNNTTNSGATTQTLGEKWGPSPLRETFTPGEVKEVRTENPVFAASYVPLPEHKFNLNISTYYVGNYKEEVNDTAGPACNYGYGQCSGVGATLDLRWTQYVSVFVNGLPPNADTYTAIPEGS